MQNSNLSCPIPLGHSEVTLGHGGGGRLTQQLIQSVFLPAFSNPALEQQHDAAVLSLGPQRIAFTTDSYVVRPLFFPGGDIGKLAICGTINDLAMAGSRPRWISCAFILEEGLPFEALRRIVGSMRDAAADAGVEVVTGDTKVVDKGKGDSLFISTSGIGVIETALEIAPGAIQPGDSVIVSGDLGRHGMAILSVREGLQFETAIESDCAPLHSPVLALLQGGITIHCLRDLTRGGLTSAANELAAAVGCQIDLEESLIPVRDDVRGACELLGLDPLSVANEGRFMAFVPADQTEKTLEILRRHAVSEGARVVGRVSAESRGLVTLRSRIGVRRVLPMLSGEQLPRIC